ncbi:MAG: hypothetical protein K6T83_00140 [Alicyclobacillus sp.]|nr:hypothetical protein [Alicyclobacillus sp.]
MNALYELDERTQVLLALKAALWTNGNERKLLERAVFAYTEETYRLPESMVCSECGRTLPVQPTDFAVPEHGVTFRYVPLAYCEQCNTQIGSLYLMSALERLAEQLDPGTVMMLEEVLQGK